MARAARGRRALARCGRAREYPSCRGVRRGCSALRCAGVRGASQQRNPIPPPFPLPTVAPTRIPTVHSPPPSLLLPLPMSLLYTPSVDNGAISARSHTQTSATDSAPRASTWRRGRRGRTQGGGGVGRWGRVPPRTPRPACPMSTGGGTRRVRSVRGARDACLLARLARRLKQEEPGARRQLGQRGAHARAGGSCRGPRRNHVVLENLRAARRKRRAGAAGGRGERRL